MMTHEPLPSPLTAFPRAAGLARLLVATDFSPRSVCALRRALQLPLRRSAELLLVHVLPPDTAPGVQREEEVALAKHGLEETVSQSRERLARAGGQVRSLLVSGPRDEALCSAARDFGAELVVLGRPHRPRSRWDRTRERIAGGCIHRLPTTHLLVGGPPVEPYRRPLVAMDFSDASRRALESVLGLCPEAERVAVLHDYDTSYDIVVNPVGNVARFLEYRRELDQRARATLHASLAPYARAGARFEELVRAGEPAESILEVARQERADLIAVGRHPRTALGRLIRPHVAEQIASGASCDVLIQVA